MATIFNVNLQALAVIGYIDDNNDFYPKHVVVTSFDKNSPYPDYWTEDYLAGFMHAYMKHSGKFTSDYTWTSFDPNDTSHTSYFLDMILLDNLLDHTSKPVER
jgi:hypothetical protein